MTCDTKNLCFQRPDNGPFFCQGWLRLKLFGHRSVGCQTYPQYPTIVSVDVYIISGILWDSVPNKCLYIHICKNLQTSYNSGLQPKLFLARIVWTKGIDCSNRSIKAKSDLLQCILSSCPTRSLDTRFVSLGIKYGLIHSNT